MRIPDSLTAQFLRLLPLLSLTPRVLLRVVLLAGVGLADLFLLSQRQDIAMASGMRGHDTGQTVVWLLTCRLLPLATACAATLVLMRVLRSAYQQHAQTQTVLRPLLARPTLAAPAHLVPLLQTLQLEQRTLLIACEFPVALCYGLLHPRLLVSTAALRGLSSPEVEAVLRHEQVHLRRHDPLRRLLVRALTEALPLPALQDIAHAVPLAQELAADRAVLAAVGPEALSGALLKVGDALDSLQAPPKGSNTQDWRLAVGAFSAIDIRIDQILGAPIPGQPGAAGIALPLLVLVLLASGPLLCLLLPFPTPIFWAGGVLTIASWQRLRLLTGLITHHGP
jgi:Zn-dependent protease with chaperone function